MELRAQLARHMTGVCMTLGNPALAVPALRSMDISVLRVAVLSQADVAAIKGMLQLWPGLRFNALVTGYVSAPVTWEQQIPLIRQIQAMGALGSLECPNEQNVMATHAPGQTARYANTDDVKAGAIAWAKAIRSTFPDVPLYGPTVVAWSSKAYADAYPNLSGIITHAAVHKYSGPGYLCNDNGHGDSPENQGSLPWVLGWARAATGVYPAVLTETGCSGAAVRQKGVVDLRTQAKVVLCDVLDAMALGIQQTFLYRLNSFNDPDNNKGVEYHYGLTEPDFTLKPAGEAIARFQALLRDTTTAFTPKPLSVAVSGMDRTASAAGQYIAFRKSDRTDLIAVWNEPRIWGSPNGPIEPSPLLVTVGWGAHRSFDVIDLLDGSVMGHEGASAEVSLRGYPVVIKLKP